MRKFSSFVWKRCEVWLGLQLVHHSSAKSHFLGFGHSGGRKKGKKFWSTLWVLVLWVIWKHRNKIIFDNKMCDVGELFDTIQVKSWAVVRAIYNNAYFSFSDWCLEPRLCMNMIT